jgi:hypothetical protein
MVFTCIFSCRDGTTSICFEGCFNRNVDACAVGICLNSSEVDFPGYFIVSPIFGVEAVDAAILIFNFSFNILTLCFVSNFM